MASILAELIVFLKQTQKHTHASKNSSKFHKSTNANATLCIATAMEHGGGIERETKVYLSHSTIIIAKIAIDVCVCVFLAIEKLKFTLENEKEREKLEITLTASS